MTSLCNAIDMPQCGVLCANMTSSIKPEVQNIGLSQRRRSRTYSHSHNLQFGEDQSCSYGQFLCSRMDTDKLITKLQFPFGGGVIIKSFETNRLKTERPRRNLDIPQYGVLCANITSSNTTTQRPTIYRLVARQFRRNVL